MSTESYTTTRFSADDTALVLIDHQSGIMQLVHDYSPAEFRNNVMALAKLGKAFKLPTILTTSLGQGPNGRFIPEVRNLFPDVPVIDGRAMMVGRCANHRCVALLVGRYNARITTAGPAMLWPRAPL
jgi:nicotinamidase-related amidase